MPLILFLLVSGVWSCSFILMKRADLVFGPISIAAYRVAGGALILIGISIALCQWQWPKRHHLIPGIIIVSIGYIVPYVIQPYLVPLCGSGFIGMIVGFVPLFTILVSLPLLRKRPNRSQLIGVIGGLACLGLVVSDGFNRDFSWWYMLIALVVPMVYATANTLVKRSFHDVPPLVSSSWCLGGASIILLPLGLILEPIKPEGPFLVSLGSVLILGVIGTGLMMYAFYTLINMRGPLYAGLVAYIIPIGAVLIGGLDGETISNSQTVAMIGIICTVVLVQRNTDVAH